ncbi:MAG: ribonuclease III [Chlamydiae bacterium]|nr:ribonuclease III [Chlamydiota bacterium]
MNPIEKIIEGIQNIERKIEYTFQDKQLLLLSFVHRSFFNEMRDLVESHNERLEFLGDAVLGVIISSHLYQQFPQKNEGELSQLKSYLVDATACASYLQKLDISSFILLGRGERMNDGKGRETILADLFEALVGAIYLDGGIESAKKFFFTHFSKEVELTLLMPSRNWKAELQDYSQKKYQTLPIYKIIEELGPDHNKLFVAIALVQGEEMGTGKGSSKKQAEIAAAENAMQKISIEK